MLKTEIEIPDMDAVKDVAINRARKQALEKMMQLHAKALKNRTRTRGVWQSVKGFKRRTRDYEKRKGKVRAGTSGQPHRFFGDTEKRIRAAPVISKSKQAFINITGLNVGYRRRPKPRHPNMSAELQAMTPKEQKQYAELYQKELVDIINNDPKARKKKRIKS